MEDESQKESDMDANYSLDEINCLTCHMPQPDQNNLDFEEILQHILENQLISKFPNISVTSRSFCNAAAQN